ncbi:hypothetical protein MFLAVUS_006312 [Mucor flavus]|uniref:Uncharacterized protein n=1 Tax=Mucor flavus TaxID=439312 RepID=A0ABP9Z176_9FUNG
MVWLPKDSSFNTSLLPTRRQYFSSAISSQSDSLYLIGGSYDETNTPLGIIRYDLINQTSVIDLATEYPSLKFSWLGGCANMLPNGVVVLAFGADGDFNLYNSSEVLLFDTNINEIRIQPTNGIAPTPRILASSTLGPDKTTIYYFGGQDETSLKNPYAGLVYGDLAILDTNTWSWIRKEVTGVKPSQLLYPALTVFGQNKIFLSADVKREPIESSNLQWSENFGINNFGIKEFSSGAIAGIVIGVLLFTFFAIFVLWRYIPATKDIAKYTHRYFIINSRSGEPLWAETTRLLVRFVLLVLFLLFVVYVTYRSIDSPIVSQYITEETYEVLIPDIRFCFNGFSETNFIPFVSCTFINGTSCSDKIVSLDRNKHTPLYKDFLGNVSCRMFYPGPNFYIYTDVQFSFFAEPLEPDYNPNLLAQELDNKSKITIGELLDWSLEERLSGSMETILLRQGVVSAASYTLTTIETMRKNDVWNYIGVFSSYDDWMSVKIFYKDSPQNIRDIPKANNYNRSTISQLLVRPDSLTLTTSKDQKVFTLLNAFAQVGGVLGLFISIQTILFGFRPQSPWGIIHRWSFGNLRAELTDKLADSFNEMGKPVPLFDPICNRLNSVDRQNLLGSSSGTSNNAHLTGEDIDMQDDWKHRMEDRLHLMEHVLKNYYLDDEIFRSLKKTADCNREDANNIQDGDNCSVTQNDALKEDDNNNDVNALTNDISRSSSLISRMRNQKLRPDSFNHTRLVSCDEEYK